jgi:hypothetical protein
LLDIFSSTSFEDYFSSSNRGETLTILLPSLFYSSGLVKRKAALRADLPFLSYFSLEVIAALCADDSGLELLLINPKG